MLRKAVLLMMILANGTGAMGQDLLETLPQLPFHLTSWPWKPLNVPRKAYLDAIEGVCRFSVQHQDAQGAVIDPFLHREHQYSTPYLAFAIETLIHAGRALDLLESGVRAMDHATECFARGDAGIPDAHGEFFSASLPGAMELYQGHVPVETLNRWRGRLRTHREQLVRGPINNWRTYAMRGEWNRALLGLADKEDARRFVENSWLHTTQRDRIFGDPWNLYLDWSSDPDSLAVEAVGRVNLLSLTEAGHYGKSAAEILECVDRGTTTAMLLHNAAGQCPRTGGPMIMCSMTCSTSWDLK